MKLFKVSNGFQILFKNIVYIYDAHRALVYLKI